jgi:hypothetical protein
MGLFWIFWFGPSIASRQKEKPGLAAGPSLLSLNSGFGLATSLALLIGVLGLTARILLLAGLLAAALLLAGLLTRVLVLLARVLVGGAHLWDLPCWTSGR